jgi:3-oxoacyl-[acyl-carrier protein] reductase
MNRTVLISGASKGIGRALADRLAQLGHTVIGTARRGAAGFPGELHTVDLSDRNATSAAMREISSTNRIDAVVNNVGLVRPQALEEVTLEALDAVLDLNLRTAIQLSQAVLPGMRQQGWGRVVNIASLVALGAPQRTAYAAAKAALISFTRGWGWSWPPPVSRSTPSPPDRLKQSCFARTTRPEVRAKAVTLPWFPWGASVAPTRLPQRSRSCCPTRRRSSPVKPSSSTAARLSGDNRYERLVLINAYDRAKT